MSGYRLELYNNTNATRIGILALVKNTLVTEEIEGENVLSFEISNEDELFSSIVARKYMRVVDNDDSANYKSYIIQKVDTIIGQGYWYRIYCEALKYALIDNMLQGKNEYINITVTTAVLIAIAGASGWSAGSHSSEASSTNLNSIVFDWCNSLEALRQIVDTWFYDDSGVQKRFYYSISESKVVRILTADDLGSDKNFYIHFDRNMRGMTRHIDCLPMANRVYGVGADGFGIIRANSVKYLWENIEATATGGDVTYLEDTNNIDTDDMFNGWRFKIHTGTGSGQKRIVDDTIASTNRITPTVDFGTAPDNTSQYYMGYHDEAEGSTYILGSPGGGSNDATFNKRVIVNYKYKITWSSGTDDARIKGKVQLRKSDDSVVVNGGFFDQNISNSFDGAHIEKQTILEVGENVDIRKLYFELTLVAFGGATTGSAYAIVTDFSYALAPNSHYIDDATSQSTYGIVTDKYENSNIVDVDNIVDTPALDGAYTSGLCANWTREGLPTITENTTATFIHHGTKSQKVVTGADDEGISQIINIIENKSYSAYFRLYVTSGAIRCSIISGANESFHIVNAATWVEITIENFSFDSTTATISIISETEATEFYVDAVQVAEGAESKPFHDGDSADLLYSETNDYLQIHKDPEVSYDLDLLNMYEHNRGEFSEHDFNKGDRIRIVDDELSLDSKLLVNRKSYDPLSPQHCSVRLEKRRFSHQSLIDAIEKFSSRTYRRVKT